MNLKMHDLHPAFSECLVLMLQFNVKIDNSISTTLGDFSTLKKDIFLSHPNCHLTCHFFSEYPFGPEKLTE